MGCEGKMLEINALIRCVIALQFICNIRPIYIKLLKIRNI